MQHVISVMNTKEKLVDPSLRIIFDAIDEDIITHFNVLKSAKYRFCTDSSRHSSIESTFP